jgi:hypothetical protein
MEIINKIFKERLTDKLSIKDRYYKKRKWQPHKIIYNLDDLNYCLYSYHIKSGIYFEIIWYKDGKFHRDGDFPALINEAGRFYWKNGKRTREKDKNGNPQPVIILSARFGNKEFYEYRENKSLVTV